MVTITKPDEAVKEQLGDMSQYQTAFLLIDGLMDNKDELFRNIYSLVGTNHIIGGGAGYFTLEQKPCLFTNKGIFMDGAVLAMIETKVWWP